ncbi:MAG: hypothetical protein EXS40_08490 [Opitutaceae bacterium]|nr:hypothetical protein [Opitutaceae bacterium]
MLALATKGRRGEIRTFLNGIGFSPDEKTLCVALIDGKATRVVAFDVKTDGSRLHMTANYFLVRVKTLAKGAGC